MRRLCVLLVVGWWLVACGGDSESEGGDGGSGVSVPGVGSQVPSLSGGTSSVGSMPLVREAPDIPKGVEEQAAVATAQNFLEWWLSFSPSNFEPKEEWFESWEGYATESFRSEMRYRADGMWAWTWHQGRKSCCVSFEGSPRVVVGDDGRAVVTVEVVRRIYDLFATSGDLEAGKGGQEDHETYRVELVIVGDEYRVDAASKVEPDVIASEVS